MRMTSLKCHDYQFQLCGISSRHETLPHEELPTRRQRVPNRAPSSCCGRLSNRCGLLASFVLQGNARMRRTTAKMTAASSLLTRRETPAPPASIRHDFGGTARSIVRPIRGTFLVCVLSAGAVNRTLRPSDHHAKPRNSFSATFGSGRPFS